MRKKKQEPVTASELMNELENDQEYQAMLAKKEKEREEKSQKVTEDEVLLVKEIKTHGYDVSSVWDLVNNNPHPFLERKFTGEYSKAYPVLINHLRVEHISEVREGIIRALTIKYGGIEVENALLEEFNIEQDPNLKWVLANALKTAMPYHRRKKIPEITEVYDKGVHA